MDSSSIWIHGFGMRKIALIKQQELINEKKKDYQEIIFGKRWSINNPIPWVTFHAIPHSDSLSQIRSDLIEILMISKIFNQNAVFENNRCWVTGSLGGFAGRRTKSYPRMDLNQGPRNDHTNVLRRVVIYAM